MRRDGQLERHVWRRLSCSTASAVSKRVSRLGGGGWQRGQSISSHFKLHRACLPACLRTRARLFKLALLSATVPGCRDTNCHNTTQHILAVCPAPSSPLPEEKEQQPAPGLSLCSVCAFFFKGSQVLVEDFHRRSAPKVGASGSPELLFVAETHLSRESVFSVASPDGAVHQTVGALGAN